MNNPHEQPAPPMEQPVLRVRVLAADLAYGALKQLWNAEMPDGFNSASGLGAFLVQKWNNNYPAFDLLISFGYLRREDRYGSPKFILTQKAFDLLEIIPPGTKVFISYERSQSSAFALALQYKL